MDTSTVSPLATDGQEVFDFSPPTGGLILYRITAREDCTTPHRPLLKAVHRGWGEVVFFHPACGCYSCPGCAENLKFRWSLTAQHGASVLSQGGAKLDFLTVTSHEKLNAAQSRYVMAKAWPALRERVRRASASHEYFIVPEQHQDGRWHIHAIISASLPRKWWKDNARQCGFGYQSDVKEVKEAGGAGSYVAKYIGKSLQNSNLPKHHRRVRLSRNWPRLPELPSPEGWAFFPVDKKTPLSWEISQYQSEGFSVVVADPRSAWDWVNPSTVNVPEKEG